MTTEAQYTSRYAETSGRDALANARATMQRALEELDRYIERYDEAEQLRTRPTSSTGRSVIWPLTSPTTCGWT